MVRLQNRNVGRCHGKRFFPLRVVASLAMLSLLNLLAISLLEVVNAATTPGASDYEHSNEGKRIGIVTLLTTKAYIPGALVLAESLNQVNAKGDRILLWVGHEDDPRSDLTENDIAHLGKYWKKTIQLSKENGTFTACQISDAHKEAIAQNPQLNGLGRYWGTCSKFAVWSLTDYDVVVYMDADSMALNNFDFVFDYLDKEEMEGSDSISSDNEKEVRLDGNIASNEDARGYSFAAHPVPECWTSNPPQCDTFYTAFMVIKPMPNIQNYFHSLAGQQYLAEGELELLNQVIQHWKPLPRFTLVAQTEQVRPINPQTGRIDWTSKEAKVYDFAGSPLSKPWISHKLSKEHNNPNWHAYLGPLQPGREGHDRYMIPQIIWNEHYDRVLEREKAADEIAGGDGAEALNQEDL